MPTHRSIGARALTLTLILTVTGMACGGDEAADEAAVAAEDTSGADDPLVVEAVARYEAYVSAQVDETVAATTTFTDAVRAGDLAGARAAYAPSRQGWERIEPVAGLVEEIDGKVDARVDDFEDEDDPDFTGWHRIEHIVFSLGTTEGAAPFADQLDADLQTLKTEMAAIDIPPSVMAVGSSELIEEVSNGKITGEEDRYSGTDLWDFAANVEGSAQAFRVLAPALGEEDPGLVSEIESAFAELGGQLAEYADGAGGYRPYRALTGDDKTAMQTTLASLSEDLATMSGVLRLG